MFSSWTFGRRVGIGFAITAIALVVVAIVGYRSISRLIETADLVTHTEEVRTEIAHLLQEVVDAETGQRGYVITEDTSFLEPYKASIDEIEKSFQRLRTLTADNPVQQQHLRELEAPLGAKRERMRANVALVDARRGPEAVAATKTGEGREAMVQLRTILGRMDKVELDLLARRDRDAKDSASLATTTIIVGAAASIALTILIAWVIISSLTKQIGGAVRDVTTSSTELQTSANQQASTASEQASAMAEIATTMTELLATSRQIAESAQRVSQIAGETATAARSGTSTVQRGTEASAVVRRQVDQIVTHMVELGKKSQQVGAVLDIVTELAEQSNILAINATIEAAGAGEAGRRFGVVAEELRNLADRVGASTQEIRSMVEDVRSAVNTTVMATEAGSKAVDLGAVQVAETAAAFTQITALVKTTTEAAREIELSTKQQATAVEQVNVAVTNVAQTTREAEASASQTLQTSGQLTALSGELGRIIRAS
jgi:methyl-accepting chemotaxis protein